MMEDVLLKLNPGLPWQNCIQQEEEYFYQQTGLKFEEETSKMLHLEHGLLCAQTCTLRAADQKYLESFDMWCWRRMEKISWTDHVRNEEVLLRFNEQINILHEIRNRKANRIGKILHRNCLLNKLSKER